MIIDCHGHCTIDGSYSLTADDTVRSLDLYGVDKICCSAPITSGDGTPELVRHRNDLIIASVEKYPDRIMGMCFVNPGFFQETQDEVTRCVVDHGLVGVKLYNQYRINEPVQFPLIERCIELGVPILMHAGYPASPEMRESQPRISTGAHFADVAKRYPDAMLICAHIGGGGDWERQLKGLREAPSVYLDTSGSVIDAGMIERCVRELGIDRLLFACDGSMARGLGKIADADLTDEQRTKLYSENFLRILARRKI